MTKKMKKLTAMLLAGMLVAQGSMSVMALDSIDADDNAVLISKDALFEVLAYVESTKEAFGLGDVDFAELEIGAPIPAFEYTADGFEESYPIYPLYYEGEIVATACSPEGTYFQIDNGIISSALNNHLNDSVAVVYDANGTYLFNETHFNRISSQNFDTNRAPLYNESSIFSIDCFPLRSINYVTNDTELTVANLSTIFELNYTPDTMYDVNAVYTCDNIEYVYQGDGTNLCWAASMACVLNYLKPSENHTVTSVANEAYEYRNNNPAIGETNTVNMKRSATDVAIFMQDIYDEDNYFVCNTPLTDTVLLSKVMGNYPVMQAYYNTDESIRHMVVAYGINTSSEYAMIMDPSNGFSTAYYYEGNTSPHYQYTDYDYYGSAVSGIVMTGGEYVTFFLSDPD